MLSVKPKTQAQNKSQTNEPPKLIPETKPKVLESSKPLPAAGQSILKQNTKPTSLPTKASLPPKSKPVQTKHHPITVPQVQRRNSTI